MGVVGCFAATLMVFLFSAIGFGSERSELLGSWRVKTGAGDSTWSDPGLDDSNWDLAGSAKALPPGSAGNAVWYRISFAVPALAGKSVRLILDPVFDGARAWLNGHEFWGVDRGSDALEFDVVGLLRSGPPNVLAVCLGRSKSVHPGAHLLIGPRVFISNQRLTAIPNDKGNGAEVTASVWVTNSSENTVIADIETAAAPDGGGAATGLTVSPGTTLSAELHWTIAPKSVRLWDQEHPNLYKLSTSLEAVSDSGDLHYRDLDETSFGIRKIDSHGGDILLNGKADQSFAHVVADEASPGFLTSADTKGLALIEDSDGGRSILRSMVTRDWNHPSVIAWGIHDQADADFVRALDGSRVIRILPPKKTHAPSERSP